MSATTRKQCSRCGVTITPDALWGLCHKCLFDEATALPASDGNPISGNRHFGDYKLGGQIGRGGMGVVYEAVQVSLRRPVALKMILDSEAGSPLAHRRFRMEAEAAAKLDHPNIVPIYEIGEHDGQSFLSMRFIAGQTLREKILSGDFCLKPKGSGTSRTDLRERTRTIVGLMAVVARAVSHAHEKNILHRDLKPSNIIVDREGQPHLTDFGLAKVLERNTGDSGGAGMTESGTTLGTPSYMSPEQAGGQRVSAASDIYSLGAILYEMLTGEPPFKAPTVLETLRQVADQQPRRPSTQNARIDPDLDTICLKCLEKNPAARYASALALAEDLERWLRHEPIRARPASLFLRSGRWAKRNPAGATLIVCLFLGITVALQLLHIAHERQKRLREANDRLYILNANNAHMFNEEVEKFWNDTNKPYVEIRSARLAQMANVPLRSPSPDPIRLTYAAVVNANPYGQAMNYAPVFAIVEKEMEKLCGRPVFIDLRLYKFDGDGSKAPVSLGEVELQRLGPLRYIQARQAQPSLELVVREKQPKDGVVFARKGLGISTLEQTAGSRIAFAGPNSTISFLTKVELFRAGLSVRDFTEISNLTFQAWPNDSSSSSDTFEAESDAFAHREVMRQVLNGTFDVGEGPRLHFERNKHRKQQLVELASFTVIPDVIVAKSNLSSEVIHAFRTSLISFKGVRERELLRRLKQGLEGFANASDRDYDSLRSMLTNEVRRFEFPEKGLQNTAR